MNLLKPDAYWTIDTWRKQMIKLNHDSEIELAEKIFDPSGYDQDLDLEASYGLDADTAAWVYRALGWLCQENNHPMATTQTTTGES